MGSSHWLSLTLMPGEHRESKKAQLAFALARGQSVPELEERLARVEEQLDDRQGTRRGAPAC